METPSIVSDILINLLTVVLLLIAVVLHEGGHVVIAKFLGKNIIEYSIGLGPVFYRRYMGLRLVTLKLFPLGAAVSFSEKIEKNEKLVTQKSLLVHLAGPLVNILIAITLLWGIFYLRSPHLNQQRSLLSSLRLAVNECILYEKWSFGFGPKISQEKSLRGPGGRFFNNFRAVSQEKAFGSLFVLRLFALINLHIGVFNLIPIPCFDGGQILKSFIRLYRLSKSSAPE